MVLFVVYDIVTGDILRRGSCPSDMIEAQASGGDEGAIEGTFDGSEEDYMVQDGKVVARASNP
jgi:hypothetical protein